MRGGVLVIAAVAVFLLAACGGGGGGSRLSAAEYRAKITEINQQAAAANTAVALALKAATLAELRHRLDDFATSTQQIGDEVAKLNPPKNAETANTQLAGGMHDTAEATRTLSKDVAGLHTPQEAIAYIEHRPNNLEGAREVNEAFATLTRLGYLSGS